jgi:alanine-glyoxylate transaminase/(R)-3-amino-2-methylpropionate-pyruvate transaminase
MKTPTLPPSKHQPRAYTGPSAAEVLALRHRFMNPGIFLYYKSPVMIVEGAMQYVWDEQGRRYLDGIGGIVTVSVGHCHPHVTAAGNRQSELYQHSTTLYLHPNVAQYAEKLASKLPGELKVCYFVNSGSEANDLALLMARAYTGNYDVIALRNAYHGGNASGMSATAQSTWKYNVPHSFGVHHALAPYPYRGPWGYDDPGAGKKYANDVKEVIDFATPGKVAAFIAESIQGLRTRPRRRRRLHCRRSADRLWSHGHAFLGLRDAGRDAGHRHAGERHWQRLPAGCGCHHAEDCAVTRWQGPLQHLRRQSGGQRDGQGRA